MTMMRAADTTLTPTFHFYHGATQYREYGVPGKRRANQYLFIGDFGYNDIAGCGLIDSVQFYNNYVECIQHFITWGHWLASDIYITNLPEPYNVGYTDAYIPCNRATYNAFNRVIKRICNDTGVHFCDLHGHFMSIDPDGHLYHFSTGSHIHFNDAGNAEYAAFMATQVVITRK